MQVFFMGDCSSVGHPLPYGHFWLARALSRFLIQDGSRETKGYIPCKKFQTVLKFPDTFFLISDKFRTKNSDATRLKHCQGKFKPTKLALDWENVPKR